MSFHQTSTGGSRQAIFRAPVGRSVYLSHSAMRYFAGIGRYTFLWHFQTGSKVLKIFGSRSGVPFCPRISLPLDRAISQETRRRRSSLCLRDGGIELPEFRQVGLSTGERLWNRLRNTREAGSDTHRSRPDPEEEREHSAREGVVQAVGGEFG